MGDLQQRVRTGWLGAEQWVAIQQQTVALAKLVTTCAAGVAVPSFALGPNGDVKIAAGTTCSLRARRA